MDDGWDMVEMALKKGVHRFSKDRKWDNKMCMPAQNKGLSGSDICVGVRANGPLYAAKAQSEQTSRKRSMCTARGKKRRRVHKRICLTYAMIPAVRLR